MGVNDLIEEWRKVQSEWMDATDAADELADLARTAWHPVSVPPTEEDGDKDGMVLCMSDPTPPDTEPVRKVQQYIQVNGLQWARIRDVVLMPPEDK